MQLWLDGSLNAADIELPPSGDEWNYYYFELGEAHQVSFTVKDANGSVSIRDTKFRWKTLPGFENLLEIGECPVHPLPGVGDSAPKAPTAKIKARNSPCVSWDTQRVTNLVSKEVEFDASDSNDENFEPLNYVWDFGDGKTATGKQVFHAFSDPGFYSVELQVTDASGRSDKDTILAAVRDTNLSNKSPTPVITLNRKNLLKPFTTTTLWGDVSYDVDGDEIEHVWYTSFSDEIVSGPEINIAVADDTAFGDVWLGVSDGRGGIDFESQRITVADYPGEDCEITYESGVSTFRMDIKIYNNSSLPRRNWTATWHMDNEVSDLRLHNVVPYDRVTLDIADSRSFTVGGDYIPEYSWITFRLSFGNASTPQEIGFKPQNGMKCVEHFPPSKAQSPYARINTAHGDRSGLLNFSADISDAPEHNKIVSYLWDFGDGTKSFEKSGTHQYSYESNFRIKLTVSQGPLTADGRSNGALTTTFYEDFRVFGGQYVACYPSVIPTENNNEYLIKAIYWDTSFTHGFSDPRFPDDPEAVTLNSGQITFSTPVVITQAASATGIELNTATDDVSFALNKVVELGGTASVQMTAVIEDIDKFYFTSCTFR